MVCSTDLSITEAGRGRTGSGWTRAGAALVSPTELHAWGGGLGDGTTDLAPVTGEVRSEADR
jgi:hypothetical protein